RLQQREEAQDRIRADGPVGPRALTGGGAHGDGVTPLQVGHGAGRYVADAALKALGPLVVRLRPRVAHVEHLLHVALGLLGALPHHHLTGGRALAPVDVSGVIPLAHRAHRQDLIAVATGYLTDGAAAGPAGCGRQAHRVYSRVDDQLSRGGELPRLLDPAERETSCHSEANVAIPAAAARGTAVGRDLCGARAHLQEDAALVRGLSRAQVFDLNGVARDAALVVVD